MIKIRLIGQDAFIWKAEDWMTLRQDHRILGNLYGCLAQVPRQDVENGLPMKLMPEEVTLIKEKKLGTLTTYADPSSLPSEEIKQKYNEYSEKIQKEQVEYYEEKRKREVQGMIDKIVEGKKRKLSKSDKEVTVDREAILKAELAKTNPASLQAGVNVQIPTAHPWFNDGDIIDADWNYPSTPKEKLMYKVFKDLYDKGYYISSGKKFGGDFLVYPGEPLKFHAFFIVSCILNEEHIPFPKIITHSRLGTVTKKTYVIASTNENEEIVYNSFEWTGLT